MEKLLYRFSKPSITNSMGRCETDWYVSGDWKLAEYCQYSYNNKTSFSTRCQWYRD